MASRLKGLGPGLAQILKIYDFFLILEKELVKLPQIF